MSAAETFDPSMLPLSFRLIEISISDLRLFEALVLDIPRLGRARVFF